VPRFEPSILIVEYGLWRSGGLEGGTGVWNVLLIFWVWNVLLIFCVSCDVLACSSSRPWRLEALNF
jgi:hypothetical protein